MSCRVGVPAFVVSIFLFFLKIIKTSCEKETTKAAPTRLEKGLFFKGAETFIGRLEPLAREPLLSCFNPKLDAEINLFVFWPSHTNSPSSPNVRVLAVSNQPVMSRSSSSSGSSTGSCELDAKTETLVRAAPLHARIGDALDLHMKVLPSEVVQLYVEYSPETIRMVVQH